MGESADDARRWLHAAVTMHGSAPFRLLERGWVVVDDEGDDGLVEADRPAWRLIWPPTAPVAHPGITEPVHPAAERRPGMFPPRRTPWTRPTRLTSVGDGWILEYGATEAHPAAPDVEYGSAADLSADLERIECWPMSVPEWRRRHADRVVSLVVAHAHDDHHQGVAPTEPYASRIDDLWRHLRYERPGASDASTRSKPTTPRPRGDLQSRLLLLDADSWVSAERTRQAGGPGWDAEGRSGG